MQLKNFGYSLKNIPIPSKNTYLKGLTDKVENFIRRIRWKAYFFDNQNEENAYVENFGIKSTNVPPRNQWLIAFEDDLYELIRTAEFRKVNNNEFQEALMKDIKDIKANSNLLVPADKTTNLYEMPKADYEKLLKENITKSYRKGDNSVYRINNEAKAIAAKIGLDKKMECFIEKEAYITLKDHKDDFQNNPKCRLINPSKSQMGIVSKKYLEKIVADVSKALQFNQWRNTDTVIKWFKTIAHKKRSRFIKFDIADFYPSISEPLLDKAINFAKQFTDISDDAMKAINHARKCFLVSNKEVWVKKNSNNLFDVTMGSYDGAEICELVGLLLLNDVTTLLGKENVGLYRDDGLAVVDKATGPKLDRMRKDIIAIFKNHGLSITIDINLKIVEFLDVTFNLHQNKYYPYRKPNDTPLYVNANSNHPSNIIKQIPEMINERISNLSCNAREFNNVKNVYQAALNISGYNTNMEYKPKTVKKKCRKRKTIWFNPPHSSNVKTNVGKVFLGLIKKHFPRHHRYSKIFNVNTIKISYSSMPNIGNIIKQHNAKILQPHPLNQRNPCNCINPEECPLNGLCNSTDTVYKATVDSQSNGNPEDPTSSANSSENIYYGICAGKWKPRYRNHVKSFNHRRYETDSKLSEFIWKLKGRNIDYSVKWEIVTHATPYKCGTSRCNLCLTEKVIIARSNHKGLLNKRTELMNKCRHKNKYILSSIK